MDVVLDSKNSSTPTFIRFGEKWGGKWGRVKTEVIAAALFARIHRLYGFVNTFDRIKV
jgi:hypothetical protein